jgi:hypothetical protein
MKIVKDQIALEELKQMSQKMFENIVKAVLDIEKEIMVVDAPFHSDQEYLLLEEGSQQENLWGINLRPEHFGSDDFVVFDSMINLRPRQGNRSRSVENPVIQKKIRSIVSKLVKS